MLEICTAKNGKATLQKDGVFLLSKYDPEKDVLRALPEKTDGKFYFLFSSCLGYLPAALENAGVSPSRMAFAEPDESLFEAGKNTPARYLPTLDGLTSLMEEILIQGLRPEVVVLPSFKRAFPEEYHSFEVSFSRALKMAAENLKVQSYFSKLWVINYARNLSLFFKREHFGLPKWKKVFSKGLVVASSPELTAHLPDVKKFRKKCGIVAVLSAVPALKAFGIKPDLVVMSDAGAGNLLHAFGLDEDIPILASVYSNSALLSKVKNPVMFYDLMNEVASPRFAPGFPSVTFDAGIMAAKIFHKGTAFLGFGLSYSGEGSHARPSAFDSLRPHLKNRLSTAETRLLSFYRKTNLKKEEGRITTSDFQLLRDSADELFSELSYIQTGLAFPKMKQHETIGEFLGGGAEIDGVVYRSIFERPEEEMLNEIRPLASFQMEMIRNGGADLKLFTLERMAKFSLEESRAGFFSKLDKIALK